MTEDDVTGTEPASTNASDMRVPIETDDDFRQVFYRMDPMLSYAVECPVRFEVWRDFAIKHNTNPRGSDRRLKLLLQVSDNADPEGVSLRLDETLSGFNSKITITRAGQFIAISLTLGELIRFVLPSTELAPLVRSLIPALVSTTAYSDAIARPSKIADPNSEVEGAPSQRHFRWFLQMVSGVADGAKVDDEPNLRGALIDALVQAGFSFEPGSLAGAPVGTFFPQLAGPDDSDPVIDQITIDRPARATVHDACKTVKADAARRLFDLSCADITWAVFDSGIDATHPAFTRNDHTNPAQPTQTSRITRTYDFTDIRQPLASQQARTVQLDWARLEKQLQVPPPFIGGQLNPKYRVPKSPHGTHVAGILGADWPTEKIVGCCPDINIWDIRVLDDDDRGTEFNILAALQFIRWMNARKEAPAVVGVNLSLSIPHEVENHSCGWTPVCIESDRLVRSGTVVVTVAGNGAYSGNASDTAGYRNISVTDPGNTDSVITVGSTHRTNPHRHGVSYFSGRGPTADGRIKPDLLAPGESIDGPVPGAKRARLRGTSQAAPFVSGAAALLLARHRELIGRPEMVKQVLCDTATELGRDRYFQGHGLLDTLRAIQSV